MEIYMWLFIILFICHDVQGILDYLFEQIGVYTEESAIRSMLEGKYGILLVDVGLEDKLIIMNGKQYKCPSLKIDKGLVTCPAGYEKFNVLNNRDYCFSQRYSLLNQNDRIRYCFPSDNFATAFHVESVHKIECVSYKLGAPHLFVTEDEFFELCKRKPSDQVAFEFYAKEWETVPQIPNARVVVCKRNKCSFPGNRLVDRAYTFKSKPGKTKKKKGTVEANSLDGTTDMDEQTTLSSSNLNSENINPDSTTYNSTYDSGSYNPGSSSDTNYSPGNFTGNTTSNPRVSNYSPGNSTGNTRRISSNSNYSPANSTDNSRSNSSYSNYSPGNSTDNSRSNSSYSNYNPGNSTDNSRSNSSYSNYRPGNSTDNSRSNSSYSNYSPGNSTDNSRSSSSYSNYSPGNSTANSRSNSSYSNYSPGNSTANSRSNSSYSNYSPGHSTDNSRSNSSNSNYSPGNSIDNSRSNSSYGNYSPGNSTAP